VRALHILELAGAASRGIRVAEVADALKLRKQTAHNLIKTLTEQGFLERTCSPVRYRLGPVANRLCEGLAAWDRDVLAPATPIALRLARQAEATVFVGRYLAGETIARLVVTPDAEPPYSFYCWHMCDYGTALMFQAFMSRPVLEEYRQRRPIADSQPDLAFWKSYQMLDDFLALVRREGHLAFVKSNSVRIAVPIPASGPALLSILSLVKPWAEVKPNQARRLIALVRQAGRELSARIAEARQDRPAGSPRGAATAPSRP